LCKKPAERLASIRDSQAKPEWLAGRFPKALEPVRRQRCVRIFAPLHAAALTPSKGRLIRCIVLGRFGHYRATIDFAMASSRRPAAKQNSL
jgi:hypothetical protein